MNCYGDGALRRGKIDPGHPTRIPAVLIKSSHCDCPAFCALDDCRQLGAKILPRIFRANSAAAFVCLHLARRERRFDGIHHSYWWRSAIGLSDRGTRASGTKHGHQQQRRPNCRWKSRCRRACRVGICRNCCVILGGGGVDCRRSIHQGTPVFDRSINYQPLIPLFEATCSCIDESRAEHGGSEYQHAQRTDKKAE